MGWGRGGGTKLCPICARFVGVDDPTCRHCGYNFETGTGGTPPAMVAQPNPVFAPDAAPPPTVPTQVIADAGAAQSLRRQGTALRSVTASIVIALVGIGIAAAAGNIDFEEVFDSFSAQDEAPLVDDPFDDLQGPGSGGNIGVDQSARPQRLTAKQCTKRIMAPMKEILRDPNFNNIGDLFIEASNELGALSFEYQTLVDVFSLPEVNGEAIIGSPKKAIDVAARRVGKACRQEY